MSCITYNISQPIINVMSDWMSKDSNFLKRHVYTRVSNLGLIPLSLITSAVDTVVGVVFGTIAVLNTGKDVENFREARIHLQGPKQVFSRTYLFLLRAINPEASANRTTRFYFTPSVHDSLEKLAKKCYSSKNFLKRHVASRLTYTLLAISSVVTRAVEGVIGLLAATSSLLILGKSKKLNSIAYTCLQVPGIIADLFYCSIKFINPSSRISHKEI